MAQGEVEVKFSAKGAEALRAQVEAVKKTLNDLSRGSGGNGADFSKITQQLKAANVEAKKLEATLNRAARQKVNVGRGGAAVDTGGGSTISGGASTVAVGGGIVGGNKLERKLENLVGKIDEVGWQFSRLMRVIGRITMILAAAEIGTQIGGRIAYALMDKRDRPSSFNPWRDARATILHENTGQAFVKSLNERFSKLFNGDLTMLANPFADPRFYARWRELAIEMSPFVARIKEFSSVMSKQRSASDALYTSMRRAAEATNKLADIASKYNKKRDLISIDRMKGVGTKRVGELLQDTSIDLAEELEKNPYERTRALERLKQARYKLKELKASEPVPHLPDIGVDDTGQASKDFLDKLRAWETAMAEAKTEVMNAQHAMARTNATIDHLNNKMKKLDEAYQEELAREKKEIAKEWQSLEKRRDEAIYGKRDKSIEELTKELKELDKAVVENSNEIGMLNSKSEGGWDFEALREKMNELAEQVGELEAIKAEIETKQAKLEAAERERKEREGFKLGSDLPGASDSLARVGGYLGGNVFNMQITNIQREIAKNTAETARAVKGIKPAQTVFN